MKKRIVVLLALLMILSFAPISQAAGVAAGLDTITTEAITKVNVNSLLKYGVTVNVLDDKVEVKGKDVEFVFKKNSNNVSVNGIDFTTVGKTEVRDGKTYVPFRFFFETMNYKVGWANGKTTLEKQADVKYPIVVENDGKKYTIEKEPTKIVSLAPGVTEKLFRLGAEDKLIGRTQYCTYPEKAKGIKEIGTMYEPNIEQVVKLKPDLVMAETHYKEDVLKKISDAKVTISVKNSPKTIEETYDDVLITGMIINRNYEARALASTMREKVNYVSMLTKYVKRPSVYFVVGTGDGGEYTHGDNTFVNDIINVAGGINSAKDAEGFQYTVEKLVKNNPDYIFGGDWAKDIMLKNSNFKTLSALKNDKYIVINEDIFNRPTDRLVNDGLKELLKVLHPEIAKKLSF